jgi:hypothetical protein
MFGFKNVFASKTVLTTIVGAVFALLAAFGVINVGEETQAAIVAALFAIAGFFRFTATEQLVATTPTNNT